MYYRLVARHTRDHIRDHLAEYLPAAGAQQDIDITLPPPKRFDVATFVGGTVGLTMKRPDQFPALAIDAVSRTFAPTDENLYTYQYRGQISGMVISRDPEQAERLAKGYLTALDLFCSEHTYRPVSDAFDLSTLPFSFIEFAGMRSEHFGAAEVPADETSNVKFWIDGFLLELVWTISEPGNGQH